MNGTQNANRQNGWKSGAKAGVTFGSALAMVISYVTWRSIFWAIIHGLLGWVYVIYFAIVH